MVGYIFWNNTPSLRPLLWIISCKMVRQSSLEEQQERLLINHCIDDIQYLIAELCSFEDSAILDSARLGLQ